MKSDMRRMHRRIRRYGKDERGGVLILAAITFPIVIGVAALAVELGGGYLTRVQNQRVADLASYSAALAYSRSQSQTEMDGIARNVARLNGIDPDMLAINLVKSPRAPEKDAVSVTITTPRKLAFARILTDMGEMNVAAEAVAEFGDDAQDPAACILALSANQSGVTLSGGTTVQAPDCVVSSNATVSVPCGTRIVTETVTYDASTAPSRPCNGIVKPDGTASEIKRVATPDPFAEYEPIIDAHARFAAVRNLTAVPAPQMAAAAKIDFGWDQNATRNQASAAGCTATWSQPKWTLSCPGRSIVNFGDITLLGGVSVDFNLNGPAATVYNFSGTVKNSGATMRFGAGTFNIAKGIVTGGGGTTSFGAGTFRIGRASEQCQGQGSFSICNTSSLTFAGPSTFELQGGVMNTGGSTISFGSGVDNSYRFGASSTGYAIHNLGGGVFDMADATGNRSTFEMLGHLRSLGGSCLVLPASPQHDIAGNFDMSGAVILGRGIYTVDGYFALGANGGGSVNCRGQSISVRGTDVSLVVSGKETPTGGSCRGWSFCVAAGYRDVEISAPASGAMARLAVIGPQSAAISAGALFAQGGSGGRISGAFYFPRGPIEMSGGAGVSGGGAGCLQLVGSRVSLAGGTNAASECIETAGGSAGGGIVRLVR